MLKLSLGSLNMRPSCCCRSHTPKGVFDLIELLYWCFQTVLCQVVKPPLAQSIRPFARSHRDPCTSACTNVTVACLRGQRRRAADACITGAVLVCLVRSVTLATCVMWRRPCASEQGTCTPVCTDTGMSPVKLLLCQTAIKHCVGNYYLVEGTTRTRRGFSFSPAALVAGFRSSRRLQGEARLRRCCFALRRTKRRLIPCRTTQTGVLPRASSPEFQSRQAEPSFATSEVLC